MSHPEELKRLNTEITRHMSHLNKGLIKVLTCYVLGMVIMQHSGQSRIATFLSAVVGCRFATMKQQLRELTYESEQKRGSNRQELAVTSCFAPLLSWVVSKFAGKQRQIVLALDATYLKERFIILAVSVVVSGCAIPVAWHIQAATASGEWNPIWKRLLNYLQPAIPTTCTVFVLSDSGLYSKKLFKHLSRHLHWATFMRISWSQGLFKRKGDRAWLPIRALLCQGMTPISLEGQCFKGKPLACTLVLQWDMHYDQPCVLVSNLPVQHIQHNIYGIRYWIECGFKDVKRGFFHWEQTKMTCPQRAERLWLVIAIALLWLTAVGEAAADLPQWQSLQQARPQQRLLSAPLLGWIDLIISLLKGQPIPYGYLKPYPWLPLPET